MLKNGNGELVKTIGEKTRVTKKPALKKKPLKKTAVAINVNPTDFYTKEKVVVAAKQEVVEKQINVTPPAESAGQLKKISLLEAVNMVAENGEQIVIEFDSVNQVDGYYKTPLKLKSTFAIVVSGYKYSNNSCYTSLCFSDQVNSYYLSNSLSVRVVDKTESKYKELVNSYYKSRYFSLSLGSEVKISYELFGLPVKNDERDVLHNTLYNEHNTCLLGNYGQSVLNKKENSLLFHSKVKMGYVCLAWVIDSVAATFNTVGSLSGNNVSLQPENFSTNDSDVAKDSNITNIYGLKNNVKSAPGSSIGIYTYSKLNVKTIVKAMDSILAVACVSLFANSGLKPIAGLPGDFTLNENEFEYRTLSNGWLCHPFISNLVFDLARKTFVLARSGYSFVWDSTEEETINCIMNNDAVAAKSILERNKGIFSRLIGLSYPYADEKMVEKLYSIFTVGLTSVIKDPNDLNTNWNITSAWTTHSDGIGKNILTSQTALQQQELL